MQIIVFGNSSSSYDNGNKIDTSLFVLKPFLRSNYKESNIEADIDWKNQYRLKNLPDLVSIRKAASKNYVDNKINGHSIIKSNNPHPDIDLNYKNNINVGLIEVNRLPEYRDQLTPKYYVDIVIRNSVDESSLLRLDPDEKLNIEEQGSMLPKSTLTSPKTMIKLPTKNYVDIKVNDPSIIKKQCSC